MEESFRKWQVCDSLNVDLPVSEVFHCQVTAEQFENELRHLPVVSQQKAVEAAGDKENLFITHQALESGLSPLDALEKNAGHGQRKMISSFSKL